ncbi:MAG: sigma-54-dependent Fis family transcriptional regulator [Nitrospirae bacterium]|nr:sigma-54-dependent Fis family transcriptional regulator [Nitrospirota bacterium]
MDKILIVDDDKDIRTVLSEIITTEGYEAIVAGDGKKAIKEIKVHSPDLVLLDLKLPGMNGMEVLEEIKKIDRDIIVIILTGYGVIKNAVQAMKLGAFDYLTKPFTYEEITEKIKAAILVRRSKREDEDLKRLGEKSSITKLFIGESPKIMHVLNRVATAAPTSMSVLIQGESGTGKELIARMIHEKSLRHNNAFIAVDCGAIPENLFESELFGYEKGAFTGADAKKEGKFESANNGTLFLDEITNLPLPLQTKLLRIIQERKIHRLGSTREIKIDIRIVAATNTVLSDEVEEERFREDLYHRLNEFTIKLPALRERKEDIPILAENFVKEANLEFNKKVEGIIAEVMKSLVDYRWPGNVRELRNAIRKAVLLTDFGFIREFELPASAVFNVGDNYFPGNTNMNGEISFQETIKQNIRMLEKEIIEKALIQAKNNKSRAAKILQIDRMTLYSKMKSLGL